MTVYMYIVMERTQIYLEERQTAELDRRARDRGTTRSHLIREALEQYLTEDADAEAFMVALDNVFGIWAERNDLDDIHGSMREADLRRMTQLHPELQGPEAHATDPAR